MVRRFRLNPVGVLSLAALTSCGGASTQVLVDPTGGEVCLPSGRVCITIPSGAVDSAVDLRVAPASESPAAVVGEGVDITVVGQKTFTFKKPAVITFKTADIADISDLELKLRIYSRTAGADWEPIDAPRLDRVKKEISGETLHLSPFVLLRTDLLPDGGLPIGTDAGPRDSGMVIIVPPVPDAGRDAGTRDAGTPDAGTPDAGTPDAGIPDAGSFDAGTPDAGSPDAGTPDAGTPDAGAPDAGAVDSGTPDAGVIDGGVDAGPGDAGAPDAGPADSGSVDAGAPDAGVNDAGPADAGDTDGGIDAG